MQRKPEKIFISIDCVILGFDEKELKVLLIKRDFAPGKWSLIGDYVWPDQDILYAANLVLKESTGLDHIYMDQVQTFGGVQRDPTGRIVSIVYYALVRLDQYDKQLTKHKEASWFPVTHLPELIYDHQDMVQAALEKLKTKVRLQPIGRELLQEKFTIPELQALYELVLQRKLDRRNFRRKILNLRLLRKLNETQPTNGHRAADYYTFDTEQYQKLLTSGFSFEL